MRRRALRPGRFECGSRGGGPRPLPAADDDARERVVVPGEELRRRVDDEVAAVLERPEVERGGGGRVADDRRPVRGRGGEVRHREERVRRRLYPDEVGVGRRRATLVELDVAQVPALELAEEDARSVIRAFGERDRLPRREQREDEARDRRRARGEEERLAAVELAERVFGFGDHRAREARVRERPGIAVDVGPRRRAIERHARHARRIRLRERVERAAVTRAHASSGFASDAMNMSVTALRFTSQTSQTSFAISRPDEGIHTRARSRSTSSRSQKPQRSSRSRSSDRRLASRERLPPRIRGRRQVAACVEFSGSRADNGTADRSGLARPNG